MSSLTLGTRGSLLALTQSRTTKAALEADGSTHVALEIMRTTGDVQIDQPLPEIGGKGLFTQELDEALLDGRVDLAVHSLKDLPTELPDGLCLAATPARVDPRDVLVGPKGERTSLASLEPGAVVGTSSLRRAALLKAFRRDVEPRNIRGNVDTRLAKVDAGQYDAIILAGAGLMRLGLADRVVEWLERTVWLPAPAQGALGVVTRTDDDETRKLVEALNDPPTRTAVLAERALLQSLGGGCQVPIGALGVPYDRGLRLWGLVASADGTQVVRGDVTGLASEPDELGERLAQLLRERGAGGILKDVFDAQDADTGQDALSDTPARQQDGI
jgi:hydroxymethylbilane synthase